MLPLTRLIFSSRYKHITAVLLQLYWLKTAERTEFKLAALAYKSLHGLAMNFINLLTSPLIIDRRM